ncbi:hypothetical protein HJC23_012668 [Cyclotella cryptica]|uniref:HMG box domain-containing protein n=1 Tax=Cyclotella cryptica TaxID=29204 RepID=A0ABD3QMI0_9STRA|eukprot:CCRYP_004224-RA/>CCRYP_004224-RA protein AED:0.09 eAED:0.09 QI:0/-1/0/1/-1/1/1/0/401
MKAITEFDTKSKLRRGTKGSKFTGRPRRPLTSYNIFFANERKNIIHEQQQQKGRENGSEDHGAGHGRLRLTISTSGRGRAHIGFAGLAQYVSQKWKTVCKSYKMELEKLARLDKIRYDKEMRDWRLKLKFDADLGQVDHGEEDTSKFDDSYLKIGEETTKNRDKTIEGFSEDGGTLSAHSVYAETNEKLRDGGIHEADSAHNREALTYFHQEWPKCVAKDDYEPLPFQPHWASSTSVPSITTMDFAVFSRSPPITQHILDDSFAYLCRPCNETTDPSSHILHRLSYAEGNVETGISGSPFFQYTDALCKALDIQERSKFTEMNMSMGYHNVRSMPSVTAGSQFPFSARGMDVMENNGDQALSFTASLGGFDESNGCEKSSRDYSLQDIQRFFGIEPDPEEK